jgi:hypothetical protein
MPASDRPTVFSIFDTWGGADVAGLRDALVLGDRPLTSFLVKSPRRDGAPFPAICQTGGGCPLIDVWAADWTHLGSGAFPDSPVPGRVVDAVNVGDPVDESVHRYRVDPALVGLEPMTTVRHRPTTDGRTAVDSGRHVVGGETFTVTGLTPGRPAVLTARVDAREPRPGRNTQAGVVAVGAGGRPVGDWTFATAGGPAWAQSSFVLPAPTVTAPTMTVALGPRQPFLAPYPDYQAFRYWVSQ